MVASSGFLCEHYHEDTIRKVFDSIRDALVYLNKIGSNESYKSDDVRSGLKPTKLDEYFQTLFD